MMQLEKSPLGVVKTHSARRWIPNMSEAKLLLVASTGFFIDAYDLFTINLVVPLLNIQYNNHLGSSLANAALAGGVLKAATNIGCIFGQITFGALGDIYGRKKIYPTSLGVAIIGTVLTIAAPNSLGAKGVFIWMTVTRVLMGIGIGGDYPMSGSVVSDRANRDRRGVLLAFTFAMQGWGNLAGALVSIILLSAFKTTIHDEGKIGRFDAVWRLILGVILVPALATLYQRLLLPESERMTQVLEERKSRQNGRVIQAIPSDSDSEQRSLDQLKKVEQPVTSELVDEFEKQNPHKDRIPELSVQKNQTAFEEFREYFSEWRHLKNIIATTACWFFVDMSFYGISLNQSTVIAAIGYNKATDPWQNSFDNTKANLIITVAGFLPGYYFTMFFVEYIGRKPIQLGGFLLEAFFLAVVAGDFKDLSNRPAGFIICFALLQFFFNFGANSTTFIYAAEVFPTRVRSFASGFSAAGGKLGAVIASLVFTDLSDKIGTPSVLWILVGTSILGAAFTCLLPETKGIDADAVDAQEQWEKKTRST